ncbi:MAG TPA: CRISPR-associated endonuclease Cas3'' [Lentisphaeria bacterium]|nr:CRISPR-associated endonuclease Cas3'' [Lentisphaeria bacterium]
MFQCKDIIPRTLKHLLGGKVKRYAHSLKNQPQEYWQPLEVHLSETALLAKEFATLFSSGDWAHNAAWLHDLGKADSSFQGYLLRENELDDAGYDSGRINHSSAGAALAEQKLGPLVGRILAYIAAGHHAGLPDWFPSDTGKAALQVRLEEGKENLMRIENYAEEILKRLSPLQRPPPFVNSKEKNFHLWIRMLYSCLVDADFLDTEAFMNPAQKHVRKGYGKLDELKPAFDVFMDRKIKEAPGTEVNIIRREILGYCREASQLPSGLFSLTVPTGGGKTLSSMAFAMDHAVKHGKSRIIYVIPYTSIIEQTARVLGEIFGPENIVEHHSNLDPENETQHSRLASENWDAPIIVTTNVQFFESLYASRSGRCRKLHNIVNSVVILDEAQLLKPELLTPCIDAINQLVRHYGVTMLLSTATQPAPPGLDPMREIIPPAANLYGRLRRTEFTIPDLKVSTGWPELAEQLCKHEQVLCIVNTRRDCYDLHSMMPEGTIHLSALMCGEHKSKVISEIRRLLNEGRPVRVISTQLVEAGVDIDFPVVYRALAGLDSIAQAAGRCNREGRLNKEKRLGQVHVFVPPKPAPRGLLRKGEDTTRELCAISGLDPHQPESFTRYFSLFYSKVNDTGDRFNDWLVKDASPDLHFQFRTAAENFKLIDDQAQRPVFVRYGKGGELIESLRATGPTREIMRRLQRYTVNISVRILEQMKITGQVEEIGDGFFAQALPSLYDDMVGLDVFRENLPVEDLIQ